NHSLGYARVSTYGQTLDAQLKQLRGAGCTKIFREKVTGAQRPARTSQLKLLKASRPARGDGDAASTGSRAAPSTFSPASSRARPYPHPHRRAPQPGAEARPAHGPAPAI